MLFFAAGLKYSSIAGNNQNFLTWLDNWLEPVTRQSSYWNRCYQATVNGWSSYTFHSNCDSKGSTVTIIRVGNIFLEDIQVTHGVSDMINLILSQATQAQAASPP